MLLGYALGAAPPLVLSEPEPNAMMRSAKARCCARDEIRWGPPRWRMTFRDSTMSSSTYAGVAGSRSQSDRTG